MDHGDELEIAALHPWKDVSRKHRRGWFHDMLILFQEINLLEEVGGREAVYGCHPTNGRFFTKRQVLFSSRNDSSIWFSPSFLVVFWRSC